jgi:rubrerythrin
MNPSHGRGSRNGNGNGKLAELSHEERSRLLELKGTATHANLVQEFSRDAQLARLFQLFGRIAEIEGYVEVARAFREVTEAEEFFAAGHLDFIRRAGDPLTGSPVGETFQNLSAAILSEVHREGPDIAEMARTAHAEGFPDIASWFETLDRAKARHAERFRTSLDGARAVD